ncbi:hypothetical protein ACFQ1I_14190 [Kitasatospora arboriphila]
MARKRPQHTTFAETVAALPAVPDPGDEEEWGRTGLPGEAAFTDARGRRWHLVRGGLDLRTARRSPCRPTCCWSGTGSATCGTSRPTAAGLPADRQEDPLRGAGTGPRGLRVHLGRRHPDHAAPRRVLLTGTTRDAC